LWFKKYYGGPITNAAGAPLQAAYWVDNITFDGGIVPTHPNQPTLSISPTVPGLQANFNGTGGNATYDRETMATAADYYSFTDATGPVTYSINYAYVPANAAGNSFGEIVFDPNQGANSGVNTEPDWNEATLFKITINPTATGNTVQLQCKTNTTDGNGDLYDASDPTWTNNSPVKGNWTFTVTQNTNFHCVAPDGESTNLTFPLAFQSADVENFFPASEGAYVYFGAQGNGAPSEGTRWVIGSFGISGAAGTGPGLPARPRYRRTSQPMSLPATQAPPLGRRIGRRRSTAPNSTTPRIQAAS
jgi:hypothetical protein